VLATLVPDRQDLPAVLPTDRLNGEGRPVGALRDDLRRIASVRNLGTVAFAWVQIVVVVAGAVAIGTWWSYGLAVVLMGRSFALLGILGHEAAHRLLLRDRRANDTIGRWLCSYPAFTAQDAYRRAHMAHHRDEMGPEEPDLLLYANYPITRASLARKLRRDAFGVSGYKNLKGLWFALKRPASRPVALRIVAAQLVLLAVCTAFGRPWLYPLLWLLPWMTSWRVINRLRAIAEHGGMIRSDDKRCTTHHARQSWLARFWIVPYHTGWHLAHHVDSGIPWRNLPRYHAELVGAGYMTPALEYPSYLALWKALASRPAEPPATTGPR
jgi:fatty acid desaturase